MRNKKAAVLKEIVKRRGYIVIWQAKGKPHYEVGEVVSGLGRENIDLGQPFMVTGYTDFADFEAQQKLSSEIAPELWRGWMPEDLIRSTGETEFIFQRVSTD